MPENRFFLFHIALFHLGLLLTLLRSIFHQAHSKVAEGAMQNLGWGKYGFQWFSYPKVCLSLNGELIAHRQCQKRFRPEIAAFSIVNEPCVVTRTKRFWPPVRDNEFIHKTFKWDHIFCRRLLVAFARAHALHFHSIMNNLPQPGQKVTPPTSRLARAQALKQAHPVTPSSKLSYRFSIVILCITVAGSDVSRSMLQVIY